MIKLTNIVTIVTLFVQEKRPRYLKRGLSTAATYVGLISRAGTTRPANQVIYGISLLGGSQGRRIYCCFDIIIQNTVVSPVYGIIDQPFDVEAVMGICAGIVEHHIKIEGCPHGVPAGVECGW